MKKAIIGAGGFGKEVYWSLSLAERTNTIFFVDDIYYDGSDNLILGKFDFLQNNILFNKFSSSSFDKISCLLLKICFGIIIVNNLYV